MLVKLCFFLAALFLGFLSESALAGAGDGELFVRKSESVLSAGSVGLRYPIGSSNTGIFLETGRVHPNLSGLSLNLRGLPTGRVTVFGLSQALPTVGAWSGKASIGWFDGKDIEAPGLQLGVKVCNTERGGWCFSVGAIRNNPAGADEPRFLSPAVSGVSLVPASPKSFFFSISGSF